jgi:hypothetical protein
MPIGGSATELNITGAKLKVTGGVDVTGSIAYTTDATGFGSVTAQIDNDNTLNITSGKNTGVAKIERTTAATITTLTHTNVNNNTTIHIALKNTATSKGVFITLGTFASDDTVKVNYTDEYSIGPGETAMVTIRKVQFGETGVASVFVREMFTDKATSFDNTDNKPFYIKDGANYKYPLYNHTATGLTSIVINGTTYHRPNAGITTKTRPPKGLPDNTPVPSGTLKIGNSSIARKINYDVYGTGTAEAGSIYRGTTQKTRFGLDTTHNEASGSFTDSGVSSGDTYTLYLDKTPTTSTDTTTFTITNNVTQYIAFNHGTFTSSDYSSAYSTVAAAAEAGFVYSDTAAGEYSWGTIGTPSSLLTGTTYIWTPLSSLTGADVLMVAGGGGGGGHVAGGGGAGGLLHHTSQSLSGQKAIFIGSGGSGGMYEGVAANSGNNTTFTGFDNAIGGGSGGSYNSIDANSGGSGGGGGHGTSGASGTSGQGNSGPDSSDSDHSGGGGGSGGAGSHGKGGSGGAGSDKSSVFGTTYGESGWFAGGGGGGCRSSGDQAGPGGQGGGGDGTKGDNGDAQSGTKHTGGGGGGLGQGSGTGGNGGSGIVLIKFTGDKTSSLKKIPKVTGISFTSSNIVFTVQQDSGTSITHVKYTVNGGSEVTTAVGTLSVAHSLAASADISVVAWAVDTSGNQLGVKKTVSGNVPS